MDLLMQAKELGAVINSSSLCLPARSLAQFLSIASSAGYKPFYFECLYFHEAEGTKPEGTEPSIELSHELVHGQSIKEFIALADRLSAMAIERAAKRGIRPYFEVGLEPDLVLAAADIPVRR
jgi:hypothetical protein